MLTVSLSAQTIHSSEENTLYPPLRGAVLDVAEPVATENSFLAVFHDKQRVVSTDRAQEDPLLEAASQPDSSSMQAKETAQDVSEKPDADKATVVEESSNKENATPEQRLQSLAQEKIDAAGSVEKHGPQNFPLPLAQQMLLKASATPTDLSAEPQVDRTAPPTTPPKLTEIGANKNESATVSHSVSNRPQRSSVSVTQTVSTSNDAPVGTLSDDNNSISIAHPNKVGDEALQPTLRSIGNEISMTTRIDSVQTKLSSDENWNSGSHKVVSATVEPFQVAAPDTFPNEKPSISETRVTAMLTESRPLSGDKLIGHHTVAHMEIRSVSEGLKASHLAATEISNQRGNTVPAPQSTGEPATLSFAPKPSATPLSVNDRPESTLQIATQPTETSPNGPVGSSTLRSNVPGPIAKAQDAIPPRTETTNVPGSSEPLQARVSDLEPDQSRTPNLFREEVKFSRATKGDVDAHVTNATRVLVSHPEAVQDMLRKGVGHYERSGSFSLDLNGGHRRSPLLSVEASSYQINTQTSSASKSEEMTKLVSSEIKTAPSEAPQSRAPQPIAAANGTISLKAGPDVTDRTPIFETTEQKPVEPVLVEHQTRDVFTAGSVNRPENARAVASQIAASITQNPDSKSIEIALNPEELGSVKISLRSSGEVMCVSILAERPETLEMMRRHVDELSRELRELGISSLEFSFDGNGDTPSEDGGKRPEPVTTQRSDNLSHSEETTPPRTVASGLDIRL